jgi:hypothetical protein
MLRRWLVIGLGILTFLWLSIEDTHTEPVALLGIGLALLGIWSWATQQLKHTLIQGLHRYVLLMVLGGLTGLTSVMLTALLMFLKTAWHSHLFPDFPVAMMLAMLELAPIWSVAGVLLGLGLALLIPNLTVIQSHVHTPETPPPAPPHLN